MTVREFAEKRQYDFGHMTIGPVSYTHLAGAGGYPGDWDLAKLPFTTKDDLRETYPFGLFAVPNSQIVRIHASSGTTGKPTVVGYTRRDIDVWSECVARCITMAGLGRNDIIQVAYGYGLFTGGLGAHYGAEKLGATVVPMSLSLIHIYSHVFL